MHVLRTAARRLESTFVGHVVNSFMTLKGIDRATTIAAQAFTGLIPLLILASGLAPTDDRNLVSDVLIRRFHLGGSAADAVRELFSHPAGASTGVFSVVLLTFSGVSLARRLQRVYQDAWRLAPRQGVRGSLNAALALAVLLLEIGLLFLVRTLVGTLPSGWLIGGAVSVAGSLLLWTAVPWLLLDRRISLRRLLPTGALTAVCTGVYAIATTIYMPGLMTTYSVRYGLFGVTLALIGWLLCIALIVVAATVVAAEFDRTQAGWATRLRGGFGLGLPVGERTPESDLRPAGGERTSRDPRSLRG
jgi:uncharacterized BrkB/YihY/UPF0761 family membrane protein